MCDLEEIKTGHLGICIRQKLSCSRGVQSVEKMKSRWENLRPACRSPLQAAFRSGPTAGAGLESSCRPNFHHLHTKSSQKSEVKAHLCNVVKRALILAEWTGIYATSQPAVGLALRRLFFKNWTSSLKGHSRRWLDGYTAEDNLRPH